MGAKCVCLCVCLVTKSRFGSAHFCVQVCLHLFALPRPICKLHLPGPPFLPGNQKWPWSASSLQPPRPRLPKPKTFSGSSMCVLGVCVCLCGIGGVSIKLRENYASVRRNSSLVDGKSSKGRTRNRGRKRGYRSNCVKTTPKNIKNEMSNFFWFDVPL